MTEHGWQAQHTQREPPCPASAPAGPHLHQVVADAVDAHHARPAQLHVAAVHSPPQDLVQSRVA